MGHAVGRAVVPDPAETILAHTRAVDSAETS